MGEMADWLIDQMMDDPTTIFSSSKRGKRQMATDKPKIEAVKIRIHEGRLAFFRGHEATWRTNRDGTLDKGTAAKPKAARYGWTWLLDPSNAQAQATIKEIKAEAARLMDHRYGGRANWPKANEATGLGAPIYCFGDGNKLPKVYDGFKDMFYIKVSDTTRPLLGSRRGLNVRLMDDGQFHVIDKQGKITDQTVDADECPFAGSYCRGSISMYTYDNQACGVNANAISAQFVRTGDAFGRGAPRNADEEFEAAGEDPKTAATVDDDIPF